MDLYLTWQLLVTSLVTIQVIPGSIPGYSSQLFQFSRLFQVIPAKLQAAALNSWDSQITDVARDMASVNHYMVLIRVNGGAQKG